MLLKVIQQSIVYWAIVLLLTTQPIKSQQEEFPVGVFTNLLPDDDINHHYPPQDHDKIKAMGVNSVIQFITQDNRIQLQRYNNVIGLNTHFEDDYIARYASGYYSRWQAEENVSLAENYPGVKHEFGFIGTDEWRSGTDPENIGKYLVTGPDYSQNRTHRFWPWGGREISYIVKFRMKIDGNAFGNEPVCKLEVEYYAPNGSHAVLNEMTLSANDLSNTYNDKILTYTIPETIGSYTFVDPPASPEGGSLPGSNSGYTGRQGVRFNVIWLGNRELFVDYIEVYDDQIGFHIAENRGFVATLCSTHAANYPSTQWPNLKYWYGLDELQTIDNFEPYRIVDSILNANGFPRLITTYYPEWDGKRDNEIDLKRFVEQVQPERIQYYYFPYNSINSVSEMLEYQRYVMQQPWQHNFNIGDWYFVAQAFGYNPTSPAHNNWRKPTREEMRATVYLALAHGAKGMYFWNYYSYWTTKNQDTLLDAIVDINETPTDLYYEISDMISPKLKGKLGSTLLR